MGSQEVAVPGRALPETADARADRRRATRAWRASWVWAGPAAALLAAVVVRNRFLFTTRLYEASDMAANSIMVEQARRFTLLTGNYSRERFDHPGPAYLYVKAVGESLFWAATRLVPTAWNGQLLAIYALNAVFVALVTYIAYQWTRSARGALACFAVLAAFAALHPAVVTSDWMPYVYVLTYLTFVIASASVAAGHGRDAWIMALTGWFAIHGHVCFLFFVPVITCAVLAAVLWRYRRAPLAALRLFFTRHWRVWLPVAVISAVFALPIVVNLALHWPGQFGAYVDYARSGKASGHSLTTVVKYALWYWWPHSYQAVAPLYFAVVPIVAYLAAIAVIRWLAPASLRRFLVALLVVNVVSTLAFGVYAVTGVDNITSYYIGYFYWSAPVVTLLVIVIGLVEAVRTGRVPARPVLTRLTAAVAAAAAVGALTAFALAPQTQTSITLSDPSVANSGADTDQALPSVVATLAADSGGKMIIVRFGTNSWRQVTGFLVQAERTGVRACVPYPSSEFMMTSQFICTPAQIATGAPFHFYLGAAPRGSRVVDQFGGTVVTSG